MSKKVQPVIGAIDWRDLTVPNAETVRDFYAAVVGWTHAPVEMGGYSDYCMNVPRTGDTVAGICHCRGVNAKLPPQWLIYVNIADVEESAKKCVKLGGRIIDGPRRMGDLQFCVIQDPAGAYAGIVAKNPPEAPARAAKAPKPQKAAQQRKKPVKRK